jgi:hypothetical protein
LQIIEAPVFTRKIRALLSDVDYHRLQIELVVRPLAGKVIPGSGGLRKIRWHSHGKGKSGGIRVIYYVVTHENKLLMLYAYAKNEQEDLTKEQIKILRKYIEEEYP